jgi:hypothetical protein
MPALPDPRRPRLGTLTLPPRWPWTSPVAGHQRIRASPSKLGQISYYDRSNRRDVAGFWIINAADLDEALEWAKLATVAEQRPIEVRPFFDGDLDDAIRANASDAQ